MSLGLYLFVYLIAWHIINSNILVNKTKGKTKMILMTTILVSYPRGYK